MDIDRTPGVAFEGGAEEAFRVRDRGALGEGQLHGLLVCLTGADNPAVRPHRHSPLPLLDHFRVSLLDEHSDSSKHVATPIIQLFDSRIDLLSGKFCPFPFLRAAFRIVHDGVAFFTSVASIPEINCRHFGSQSTPLGLGAITNAKYSLKYLKPQNRAATRISSSELSDSQILFRRSANRPCDVWEIASISGLSCHPSHMKPRCPPKESAFDPR